MKARDNPFAVSHLLQIRFRPQECTWDQLLKRLTGLNDRAAIVGDHGTGKTTLLDELDRRIRIKGLSVKRLKLDSENRRLDADFATQFFDSLSTHDMVLLDGAEQLGWFDWRNFERQTRNCAGLIITTHRPGRLPTLLKCRTSPQLLDDLVRQLLGHQALLPEGLTRYLYENHHGNLRDALRELYDRFANMESRRHSPSAVRRKSSIGQST